jgi:hypothetical protein
MIRAEYHLGAVVAVIADTMPEADELADLAIAAAEAALADVFGGGTYVALIGPPYVQDVQDLHAPAEVTP